VCIHYLQYVLMFNTFFKNTSIQFIFIRLMWLGIYYRADGIENNLRYYGIDFNTALKRYTEKPEMIRYTVKYQNYTVYRNRKTDVVRYTEIVN